MKIPSEVGLKRRMHQGIGPKTSLLSLNKELELLTDHADARCIYELWGGRLWRIFTSRVRDFDELFGCS